MQRPSNEVGDSWGITLRARTAPGGWALRLPQKQAISTMAPSTCSVVVKLKPCADGRESGVQFVDGEQVHSAARDAAVAGLPIC